MKVREITGSTHSRSVTTTIAIACEDTHDRVLDVVLSVGATTRDSDPWPEPRCYFPTGPFAEHDIPAIAAAIQELFRAYAVAYPKVSIAFREREGTDP